MKLSKLLIAFLLLASCQKPDPIRSDQTTNYRVIYIDGCEYLTQNNQFNNEQLAHKGNCKQCQINHRQVWFDVYHEQKQYDARNSK